MPAQRRHTGLRNRLISAAAVLVAAGLAIAAGKPGVLKTKTGVVYDGIVDERDQSVVVNVRGIETTIPREEIESITYGDFESRWDSEYAKLDAADDKGRVRAARAAFDERRYDLAEKALRDAQAINPNNAEAAELLRLTINQRRLEQNRPPSGEATHTPANNNGAAATGVQPAGRYNLLTPDDVNRIKQAELREGDTKARFRFDNGVLKRYWDANPSLADRYRNFGEFSRSGLDAALAIIKDGGDLAKDVKITNDPQALADFKANVQPLILRGCATSACHGGNNEASKRFALVLPGTDQAQAYTNFYLLQQTRVNQSKSVAEHVLSGGPTWAYMIDRTSPERSLLLQYGLPPGQADIRHPIVKGYTGLFNRDDARYNTIRNFIRSLAPIQPDYGISFELHRPGQGEGWGLPTSVPTTLPGAATQPVNKAIDAVRDVMGR